MGWRLVNLLPVAQRTNAKTLVGKVFTLTDNHVCAMVFESWEQKIGMAVLHGNTKKVRTGLVSFFRAPVKANVAEKSL